MRRRDEKNGMQSSQRLVVRLEPRTLLRSDGFVAVHCTPFAFLIGDTSLSTLLIKDDHSFQRLPRVRISVIAFSRALPLLHVHGHIRREQRATDSLSRHIS